MKKDKKPRVNVIRKKVDEKKIISDWFPVLEQAGIGVYNTLYEFKKELSLYCHNHVIIESCMNAHISGPGNIANSKFAYGNDGMFTNFMPSPSTTPPTLPFIIKLVKDIEQIHNMNICVVDAPMYTLLIGDNMYVDQIESIDDAFNVPAVDVIDASTNIMEIYEERMLKRFRNTLIEYIESVPNADTLVIYNFELFTVTEMTGMMNPHHKMRIRFRIRAFEDATYIPKSKDEVVKHVVPVPDEMTWITRMTTEPSRFKKWIIRMLGMKIHEMKTSVLQRYYDVNKTI